MKNLFSSLLLILFGTLIGALTPVLYHAYTASSITTGHRNLEMKLDVAGNEMMIWKTLIPVQQQNTSGIAMHRHEYARILLPLSEGVLQRRDANGATTDYLLEVGKPILLPEDTEEGFHTDENLGKQPIEVIVLQFTQTPVTAENLTAADLQKVMDVQ